MKNEIWKDIEGYEGLYQVSTLGRVKSLGNGGPSRWNGKERILKPIKTKNGYLRVDLRKKCSHKQCSIQRLVAKAFIDNPNNFPCVNHKDENKENNCVENLEWCDYKYNNNYGTHQERSGKSRINHPNFSKRVICVETNVIYESQSDAYRKTGISQTLISDVCSMRVKTNSKGIKYISKTAGGYHWRFVD